MKHANLIKRLIKEALSTPPKKESCNCGCHSCENVGNKGPVLNESLDARVIMTENMKYHVKNKLSLTENKLKYGSEEFLNLWAEARYLYSRNAIHLNEEDKATILKTNLGEYGIYNDRKVPLDIPVLENELGDKRDVEFQKLLPYRALNDLPAKVMKKFQDTGDRKYLELHNELENLFTQGDKSNISYIEVKTVISKYLPDNETIELMASANAGLNESKNGGLKKFYVYTRNPKTKIITREVLSENSASKVYKIEGLLVTNNDIKFQNQLLSDIRSVTGVTTIDAQEYTPRIRKENYSYNKLSVKVDPYPYLKNGGKFDIDTIKQVISNIGNIKGVVKFKVDNPQMINVGL